MLEILGVAIICISYTLSRAFAFYLFLTVSYDAAGSINISNILTGKCLAKINSSNCNIEVDGCYSGDSTPRNQYRSYLMRNRVAEALEDITALFYDEERNEIYTGNRHGLVHVWSS